MPRHIPERTCVICKETNQKRALVRIVRVGDDTIEIDLTGKLAGRGAYLCHNAACWKSAVKGSRLESALRTRIPAEQRVKLAAYADSLARSAADATSGGVV